MMPDDQTTYPRGDDPSDHPNWRHWTWWLRPVVAIPLMLFVLLLLSPFLVRSWHLSKVPDIADPFDVEAFLSETVDDKDNAFADYEAAAALLVPAKLSRTEWEEVDAGWEKTSPPVRAWVTANRPALDRWRIGTTKQHSIDNNLKRLDMIDSSPNVGRDRNLARLAWLLGEQLQSEGRMSEAWQWYRGLVRFSRHVAERTSSVGRIVGVYLHDETARHVHRWAGDPRTSDEELWLALNHMREDDGLTRPFSETLKSEYLFLWKLERLNRIWELRSPLFPKGPAWRDSRVVAYCLADTELLIRQNKLLIENWLAASDVPRKLQNRISIVGKGDVLDVTAPGSGLSGDDVRRAIETSGVRDVMNFGDTRNHFDSERARQEALRVTVACQLWHRRHGELPTQLVELVPDILPELPIDPFSRTGDVIRYRRDGNEAIVYSVGLDETDDHGKVELIPGKGYSDIGYRLAPSQDHGQSAEQKPSDEP